MVEPLLIWHQLLSERLNNMNYYLLFRKVHRLLVLVMTVSISIMAFTGILLKYPKITSVLPFNLAIIRTLHSTASPLFTIVLVLMMISGVVMYFYPIIRNRKRNNV